VRLSRLPLSALALLLCACGGGSSSSDDPSGPPPPPPPPPPGNSAPVARIAAVSAATAASPLAFDGSASSDADGHAITLHWDFGDGLRGGGARIAHVFERAGRYTVTLTATDAEGAIGRATLAVDVSAEPAPARTQTVSGRVSALDGSPLADVSVQAGALTASTDANGDVSLELGIGTPQTLRLRRAGYVDQVRTLRFPESGGGDTHFDIAMRPAAAAQTLPDAGAGGTLTGQHGAQIVLPAAALVDASGAAVSGPVDIAITPIDIREPGAGGFPGRFEGVAADASVRRIVSFGTTDFVLSQGGRRLQLAPGKSAQILLPLYAGRWLDGHAVTVGERIPLWSLDEASGLWIQEGEGEAVASEASPSGLAMRANVAHFTAWNADHIADERAPPVSGRCVYDTDIGVPGAEAQFQTATLCNWLAEMDRGIGPQGGAPARGSAPRKAETLALPGFAERGSIPVSGDVLPLPANAPIRFSVTALNGAFVGSATLAADSTATEVIVKMRPLQSAGGGDGEAVTLPFERALSFEQGQVQSFRFSGNAFRYLRIGLTAGASGSLPQGEMRLLRNGVGVASGPIRNAFSLLLDADGEYRLEFVSSAQSAASLRIEQLGTLQQEALALPLDLARNLPALSVLRANFELDAPRTLFFALRENRFRYRLIGPDGREAFNFAPDGDGSGSAFTFNQRTLALPAGRYAFEAAQLDGDDGAPLNAAAIVTQWQPQGAPLEGYGLLDLLADRDGAPVLLLARHYSEGNAARVALALRRWSGSEWREVAAELAGLSPRACGSADADFAASLAFDADNRPLLAYVEAAGVGNATRTRARRYDGSAWVAYGSADGTVSQSAGNVACDTARVQLRVGGSLVLIAQRSSASTAEFTVARLDGAIWRGLAAEVATADVLDGSRFDLQLAPDGAALVVSSLRGSAEAAKLRRYDAATRTWVGVGADGGKLPMPAGQGGQFDPLLRFTASGQPIVAGGNRSAIAVFRYDGSAWTAGAPWTPAADASLQPEVGFAIRDGAAVLAWSRYETRNGRGLNTPLVQSADAADRYTAYGADDGAVPQFSPQGQAPASGFTADSGRQQKLLVVGDALYQALEASSSDGTRSRAKVTLLRHVP
jgi:hypothetical protein